MADSSLLADLGEDESAVAPPKKAATSNLLEDVGGGGTDWSNSDESVPSTDKGSKPVGEEVATIGSNVARHLPRDVIQALGSLAAFFGNNQTPDFNIGGSTPNAVPEAAHRVANSLEGAVPALQVTNPGPIDQIADRTIESGLTGGPFGAEAVLPFAMSGLGSESAKQMGAGPLTQFAAGLIPFAPEAAAAGIRGAVRGGESGRAAMEGSKAAADAAGLPSTVGSTSGSPVIRGLENVSSKLPGGQPLREARDINRNVEASVNNIIKSIHPEYEDIPATASEAGEEVARGAKETIVRNNTQVSLAEKEMNEAVGGKDAPMSASRTSQELQNIEHPTGIEEIDAAVQGAKTKATAGVIKKVEKEPPIPKSYTTDGEGTHVVKSDNGETHAIEQADGNLKVTRSDTAPEAQGRGEGTGRLETLAHAATAKGKAVVSDVSVSPQEAKVYEALGRRGWKVTKNPEATVSPDTGNIVSDSPKNPVYKVEAPKTSGQSLTTKTPTEQTHTGGWTYDPKTGKSEPVVQNKTPEVVSAGGTAELGEKTPWTFGGLRALRTQVGKQIRGMGYAPSPQKAQLQRLYGAMSEDLRSFAASHGPDAEQKFEFFNSTASENAARREELNKAIKENGGPGEIFTKAMRGNSEDAGNINRVMSAMDEKGKNTFRAVVLHRMGRAAGAQGAPFDANTFLRNYDKMSPEAKTALFGQGKSAQLRGSLDALNTALTDMKNTGRLKSGLAQAIAQGGGHTVGRGLSILGGLYAIKELAEPAFRMAETHPVGAVVTGAGLGTVAAVNPVMSRVLTNPKVVSWLATATKAPKGMIPVLINNLQNMGRHDKDAKDLSDLIANLPTGGGANSTSTKESAPAKGEVADGSDFVNPGKMTTIRLPSGRTIQAVDPSTFGSRFNNPKENPASTPPDTYNPSDYEPAIDKPTTSTLGDQLVGGAKRLGSGLLDAVIPKAAADEKSTYPGLIGKPESVARVENGHFKLLGADASRSEMLSYIDRQEKELASNEATFKNMPGMEQVMKKITDDMKDRVRLVKDILAKNKDIK